MTGPRRQFLARETYPRADTFPRESANLAGSHCNLVHPLLPKRSPGLTLPIISHKIRGAHRHVRSSVTGATFWIPCRWLAIVRPTRGGLRVNVGVPRTANASFP